MAEGKIKSKDLSYDAALPPFLQRLQAQRGQSGDQERLERQTARPKRAKDPNDDDGPTVVDDSGETISKAEYETLAKGETIEGCVRPDADAVQRENQSDDVIRVEPKITDGIAVKKRKAGKAIGDDDQGEDAKDAAPAKAVSKKVKKKAKPIKLAFDEEDAT